MTTAIVAAHAVFGGVALLSMGVPILSKKGGRTHRLGGRVYSVAMAGVVLSAWLAAALRLWEGQRQQPLFLALVGLMAGASVWAGWRVRAEKGRTKPHTDPLDRGVQGLLVAGGLVGFSYGLATSHPLFLIFGALCAVLGVGELRAMAAVPDDPRHWLRRHLASMLAGCIATTTAFLVVNVGRLPAGVRDALPPWLWWLVPMLLGVPAIVLWSRQHLPRRA